MIFFIIYEIKYRMGSELERGEIMVIFFVNFTDNRILI